MKNEIQKRLLLLLVACTFPLFVFAQKTVKGFVQDSSGNPIIGVNILVKGTTNGVITDIDGNFELKNLSDNAILSVSYIGYLSQEVSVKGKNSISIILKEDLQALDEVVVVGYGTVRKRDLTGSVGSVRGADVKAVPTQNPIEGIQGKIAGADISRGSGSASSEVSITIRGNRSIGAGNSPLYIVDGIQTGSISNINANDIESIDFLKDASSTAIYGWQGANGVVIITTKKGSEGKPKVSFNAYYGTSEVSRYPSVMNGPQYVSLKREANRTIGKWNSIDDDATIFNPLEMEAISKNQWVDYQNLLLQRGYQQDYQVGITTGGKNTKTYLSVDYYNEKGILKMDEVKRYTLRANVDHTFNKYVLAGVQSQIVYRNENYRRDPLNMANKIIPLGTVYDENGDFIIYPLSGSAISPLADEQPNMFFNEGKSLNILANGYLEIRPIDGLSVRTNFGSNISFSRTGLFEGQYSINRNGSNSLSKYSAANSCFINWDNVITYKKEIQDHSFTVTALSSYVENVKDGGLAQGEGQMLSSQLFYALGNATQNKSINSNYEKWNVLSFAARINYGYKGKYLLTLTGRTDGASRLSKGNKWAFFPSAAFAWRVSDENFMKNISFLSDLKVRLSYGVAGNSAIDPYGTQSSLTGVPMSFGESNAYGYTFSPLVGNPNAGWELSATADLGIDFGLFNNRIRTTIDYYDTRTSNLLLPRGLPFSSGVEKVYQNIGKTRNRGFELAINTANIQTREFSWSSTLTFSTNKEEIVSLVTNGVDDIGNGWFIGHETSVFYDYKKLGIWQTNEVDEAAKFGQVPGDIKVADISGPDGVPDGKIDAVNDKVVIGGNNRPKWYGGLNNTFNYKGFDLSFYIFARWGQTINPNFLLRYDRQGNLSNSATVIDYWTPENPTNEYPRPNANVSTASTLYYTTLSYVDGSYVKLKTVSLGYTFPKFKNLPISNLRIYITGNNLLTWTKSSKLDEYDPERGGGESFPMTRNYTVGLSVDF